MFLYVESSLAYKVYDLEIVKQKYYKRKRKMFHETRFISASFLDKAELY